MSFTIEPRGEFSLAASTRFLEGFTPAAYRGSSGPGETVLRLAFPVEDDWTTAGVAVRQRDDGVVVADVAGDEPPGLRAQLARILSLDVDGTGFAAVRERDPVVDKLSHEYGGLRPVGFHSPYEAACWAMISHRIRIVQAAAIKERIAEAHGEKVTVDGVELAAFPGPRQLLRVLDQLGLPEIKAERLRGIAEAALAGRLDGARLRAMDPAEAIEDVRRLDGVGPFSADLIVIRGACAPDVFATSERRLHDSMAQLYDLPDTSLPRLQAVAERWAPYRSWVGVLVRTYRQDSTGEIR
jgi:3-methyladenine DNA glycosylase/8-oxoguanine DNA glycosylase